MRSWAGAPHRISRQNTFCIIGRINLTRLSLGDLGRPTVTCWICLKQGRRPKLSDHFDRGNLQVGPPRHFVAMAMQLMMVLTAEWHRELVADLASQRPGLREFQMMGIARRALADQAGLRCHECQMGLVSSSRR